MKYKYRILLFAALAVLTAFRVYYAGTINLSYDEAYNWEWSQRLAPDYYSEPGLVGWVTALFVGLAGHSETGVRLGAIIFSLISSVILYWLALSISKKEWVAFMSVFTLQTSPLGSAGAILMMHDVVTMPFWLLAALFLWKAVDTGRPFWWWLLAPAAALAFSGKMSSLLFFPCALLFLLITPRGRAWLGRKEPYAAAAAAALLFSHNLIWNAGHGFMTYKHITGLGSASRPEFLKTTLEYAGSQVLVFTPILFFIATAAFVWAVLRVFVDTPKVKSQDLTPVTRKVTFQDLTPFSAWGAREDLAFFLSFSLSIFLFFLALSFRSKVEANWTNIAFPASYIIVFIYLSEVNWKKAVKITAAGAGIALSVAVSVLIYYPSLVKAAGVNYTADADRTNEIHGWDAFGAEFSKALEGLPGRDSVFIFGPNYQITAITRFYMKGRPQTYCLPYSDRRHNQYDVWGGWEGLAGKDGLFVNNGEVPQDIMEALVKAFRSVKRYRDIPVYRKEYKEPVRIMKVYYCKKFLGVDKLLEPAIY